MSDESADEITSAERVAVKRSLLGGISKLVARSTEAPPAAALALAQAALALAQASDSASFDDRFGFGHDDGEG